MSTVLLSLVNPRLDLDLLGHWSRHYAAFGLDRYVVGLHREDGHDREYEEARDMLAGLSWEVREIRGRFDNGALQDVFGLPVMRELAPDDTVVLADADEFHRIAPETYRSLIDEYDYASGFLLDRWNPGRLADPQDDSPLYAQYPMEGNLYDAVRKWARRDGGMWEFRLCREKVLFCRARLPINLCGSHGFTEPLPPLPRLDGQTVDHYPWRGTAIQRLYTKTYIPPWYVDAIMDYFKVPQDSPDRREHAARMRARQEEMGWEPARTENLTPVMAT